MFFLIGFLKLAANEALMVADPCYFKYGETRADLQAKIELGWPAGDYPVYVELVASAREGNNANSRLILSGVSYQSAFVGGTLKRWRWLNATQKHVFDAGVDSGQMAFAAAGTLHNWTEADSCAFGYGIAPKNDYDAACTATLYSQLGAGPLATRLVGSVEWGNTKPVATVFASSTAYGDGTYPVSLLCDGDGAIMGVQVAVEWDDEDGLDADDDDYRLGESDDE